MPPPISVVESVLLNRLALIAILSVAPKPDYWQVLGHPVLTAARADNAPELSATVARINTNDAPLNQRILIDFHGRTPDGAELMASPDFRPLIVAAETGDA